MRQAVPSRSSSGSYRQPPDGYARLPQSAQAPDRPRHCDAALRAPDWWCHNCRSQSENGAAPRCKTDYSDNTGRRPFLCRQGANGSGRSSAGHRVNRCLVENGGLILQTPASPAWSSPHRVPHRQSVRNSSGLSDNMHIRQIRWPGSAQQTGRVR